MIFGDDSILMSDLFYYVNCMVNEVLRQNTELGLDGGGGLTPGVMIRNTPMYVTQHHLLHLFRTSLRRSEK
jgi:hypothetical protein